MTKSWKVTCKKKTITAVISVLKWGQLKTQIVPSLVSNEQNLVGTIRKLASGSVALEGMLNHKSSNYICDVIVKSHYEELIVVITRVRGRAEDECNNNDNL